MAESNYDLYNIVLKLTGPVHPVGDSSIAAKRLQNLKELANIGEAWVTTIDEIATENKDRHESSRRKAGIFCSEVLDDLGIIE